MADRLEQIRRIKAGIGFAKDHVDNENWYRHSCPRRIDRATFALVEGEDLNHQSDPDLTITLTQDCGEDNQVAIDPVRAVGSVSS